MNIAINYKIPKINIISQKETFDSVFLVIKFFTIKDWLFSIVVISLVVVSSDYVVISSDRCFSHKLDRY